MSKENINIINETETNWGSFGKVKTEPKSIKRHVCNHGGGGCIAQIKKGLGLNGGIFFLDKDNYFVYKCRCCGTQTIEKGKRPKLDW